MALLKDKNKPGNIYDKDSATAKAQQATSDVVLAPVNFAGRQLDTATAPIQRLAGSTVVPMAKAATETAANNITPMASVARAARPIVEPAVNAVSGAFASVGNRLATDAAATKDVAMRSGLRQSVQNMPQGDPAGLRDIEAKATSPAPMALAPPQVGTRQAQAGQQPEAPLTDVAVSRALDAELYGPDGVKRIGGNAAAPQPSPALAVAAPGRIRGNNIDVHMTPNDLKLKENLGKIDRMLASGVTPTAAQAESIAQLRRDAGFLRGGTDRVPVGPDGKPIRLGGGGAPGSPQLTSNGGLQIEAPHDVVQKFQTAVHPNEYTKEAQDNRNLSTQQYNENLFVQTNGKYGTNPKPLTDVEKAIGIRLSDYPKEKHAELIKAGLGGMAAKDANEVARMTATGQAAESKVGLKVKENALAAQEKTSKLLDEYSKATPERQTAIEKELVMLGAKQPRAEKEKKVHFRKTYDEFGKVTSEEPFLLDEDTAEGRPIKLGGGAGGADKPLPTRIPDRKEGEVYTTTNGKFKWDGKGLIRVQ